MVLGIMRRLRLLRMVPYYGVDEPTYALADIGLDNAGYYETIQNIDYGSGGFLAPSQYVDRFGGEMYLITAANGKYFVDGVEQSSLSLDEGQTYVFDWSNATHHPLRFSTTPDGVHASGVEYTEGVADTANFTTTITAAENAPDLHYYRQNHPGMGGSAVTDVSEEVALKEQIDNAGEIDISRGEFSR